MHARRGNRNACRLSASGTRRGGLTTIYDFGLGAALCRWLWAGLTVHLGTCGIASSAAPRWWGKKGIWFSSAQQCSTFATIIRTCSGTASPCASSSTRQSCCDGLHRCLFQQFHSD